MTILTEYWYIIAALIVLLTVGGFYMYGFIKQPSEVQLRKVKAWLLLAVTQAEAELGGGTGQLKLRYVYDLFVERFSWLARIVSFDLFSELVDQALDEMKGMLETNPAAATLVYEGGYSNVLHQTR